MVKKRKRAARVDLATEDMLLAEEDLAAMRPALAVAPELVLQTIQAARRRSARMRAGKKAAARKTAAKNTRKAAPKIAAKIAAKTKSRASARKKKARA